MKKSAQISLLFVFMLTLLAGCQNNSASTIPDNLSSVSATSESSLANTTSYPRTIKHAGGTTTLDQAPKRVAAVSKEFIDLLVLLDEPPMATKEFDGMLQSSILSPYVEGLEIIELGTRASREAILEMNPDLILISEGAYINGQFEELNQIAPTIVVDTTGDYRDRIRQLGEIYAKEDKAEEIIADYEAKIAETKTALVGFEGTLLILRANGKNFTVLPTSDFEVLYDELGIKPVETLTTGGELTIEGLSTANPDYIFIAENGREMDAENPGSLFNNWKSNSVWQSLDAVKKGNVYYMDSVFIEAYYASQITALDSVAKLSSVE